MKLPLTVSSPVVLCGVLLCAAHAHGALMLSGPAETGPAALGQVREPKAGSRPMAPPRPVPDLERESQWTLHIPATTGGTSTSSPSAVGVPDAPIASWETSKLLVDQNLIGWVVDDYRRRVPMGIREVPLDPPR